jgi:dTDP-4-dehydrorhamnose reductase
VSILVTGAGGMLGRDLQTVIDKGTFLTRAELDLADFNNPGAVNDAVKGHDVVINAAAWTDVDGAETDEAGATRINGDAVQQLADACLANDARLVHVSTDYVFDGAGSEPYKEHQSTDPVNAYGRSKLVGENAVLRTLPQTGYVVRTAWLYGRHGKNFVATMLRLAGERDTVEVVDDQRGQPTWSMDLARQLTALAGRPSAPAGIYHGTASGETTWFGLARAVFEASGFDPERVKPTTSAAYVRPARRPAYSVLGHDRWATAGMSPLPDWRVMLTEALASFKEN